MVAKREPNASAPPTSGLVDPIPKPTSKKDHEVPWSAPNAICTTIVSVSKPMEELFVFGYGLNKQFPSSVRVGTHQQSECLRVKNISTPTPTLRANQIKILWASWCDLICTSIVHWAIRGS